MRGSPLEGRTGARWRRRLASVCILSLCMALSQGCGPPAAPRTAPRTAPPVAPAAAAPATTERRIPPGELKDALASAGIPADKIRCSTHVRWERSLNSYAKSVVKGLAQRWKIDTPEGERRREVHFVLGYMVRLYFEQARPDNLGGMVLRGRTYKDDRGVDRPLVVFRSGLTLEEGGGTSSCFNSLIKAGGVRHVVNLYAGTFPFHDLIDAEKDQARALGVSYFDLRGHRDLRWRGLVEDEAHYQKNLAEAQRRVARLIREQLLRPGGTAPRGNIYFHCAGGMHRSGMLFGVLQRCLNATPMKRIEASYRRHVDHVSDAQPGGYEPLNLRFIRDFDCALLGSK